MRRGKASNLAKIIYRLKEKEKATFYTPSAEWVRPAASTKGPEEREFVEDSGASMHMVSRKDLNSAELETRRTSKSPTTVETANYVPFVVPGKLTSSSTASSHDSSTSSSQDSVIDTENPAKERSGRVSYGETRCVG